jgi:hypothetical protein
MGLTNTKLICEEVEEEHVLQLNRNWRPPAEFRFTADYTDHPSGWYNAREPPNTFAITNGSNQRAEWAGQAERGAIRLLIHALSLDGHIAGTPVKGKKDSYHHLDGSMMSDRFMKEVWKVKGSGKNKNDYIPSVFGAFGLCVIHAFINLKSGQYYAYDCLDGLNGFTEFQVKSAINCLCDAEYYRAKDINTQYRSCKPKPNSGFTLVENHHPDIDINEQFDLYDGDSKAVLTEIVSTPCQCHPSNCIQCKLRHNHIYPFKKIRQSRKKLQDMLDNFDNEEWRVEFAQQAILNLPKLNIYDTEIAKLTIEMNAPPPT